jgi:methionine biosynthesis protein MetW
MPINRRPVDHLAVLSLVEESTTVLDLGCGDGSLLSLLEKEKNVQGQGIEIDDRAVFECVAKGLNVFQDDIDTGLPEFSDHSFDYVILNQSFQQVKKPDMVLHQALRVGRKVIIGFPNFAHMASRCQIFFRGRTPVTPSLPYEWHDTPNLHFLSISDFVSYCRGRRIRIERSTFITNRGRIRLWPNGLARVGLFLLSAEDVALSPSIVGTQG